MRAFIERELASRADQRVLIWFRYVQRIDEYRMAIRVLMADASGGRERGRPRLGLKDGMMVAEGWRWRLHDNALKLRKGGKPWCIFRWLRLILPFLFVSAFFRTALPGCDGLSPVEECYAVTWCCWGNWNKGETTENHGAGAWCMAKGVCVGIIWFDITTPNWWREKVMVYYCYLISKLFLCGDHFQSHHSHSICVPHIRCMHHVCHTHLTTRWSIVHIYLYVSH